MLGALEADLRPGELLVAVKAPRLGRSARWGYHKICRKTGEFAHAIGAVLIDPEKGAGRAVIGALGSAPIVLTDATTLFGGRITPHFLKAFDGSVADAMLVKAGISQAAHRHIHVTALRRAVAEAAA